MTILSLIILIACSTDPQKISYGTQQCDFCSMTIVDQQHAAQVVSLKGKQFAYDAIECLINDLKEKNESDYEHILVCDYTRPATMIEAKNATYLISKEIKSPMGAFLSAGADEIRMKELKEKHGGQLFSWDQIKNEIR